MAERSSRRITRLHGLVTLAVALAGVAAAKNYAYWRRAPASAPRAILPPSAAVPTPGLEIDRQAQIQALLANLRQHPDDTNARFLLAELYFKQGDYARSLAELHRLQAMRPAEPNVYLRQAVVLRYAGKLAEAEKAVQRALALQPNGAMAHEWLGEICRDQGRFRAAVKAYDASLKIKPDSYSALIGKARALEQLLIARAPVGVAEVTLPVEKAVQLDPDQPLGVILLARMKFSYGDDLAEAEKLALRATRLDPPNAGPYILLAEIALRRPPTPENIQAAGEYAYQAGLRDLQDSRPPYQIGRVYLLQNDVPRAIQALERSLSLGARPETVNQLAMAYRRSGNVEQADKYGRIYQQWTALVERRKTLLGQISRQPKEVRHYYAMAELYVEAQQPDHAGNWLKLAQNLHQRDARGDQIAAAVKRLREAGGDAPMLVVP